MDTAGRPCRGSAISSDVDLIGWAATGTVVVPDQADPAFYRYLATFEGRVAP